MSRSVVFLHGWTMRGAVFDDQIGRLAPEFTCLAPDLPGHGAAAGLEPSLDSAADLVHRLLRDRGLSRVHLIGWSMGAAVAWRLIERFGSDRLASLMTIDMSPRLANGDGWHLGLKGQSKAGLAATERRIETDWPGLAEAIAVTMFARPDGAAVYPRPAARDQIRSNDPATMRAFWRDLAAMDLRAVIPRVDIPYLAAYGAQSRVYPAATADWLARTAPHGRTHRFDRSGHSPHLEEPEAFAACVRAFVAAV